MSKNIMNIIIFVVIGLSSVYLLFGVYNWKYRNGATGQYEHPNPLTQSAGSKSSSYKHIFKIHYKNKKG